MSSQRLNYNAVLELEYMQIAYQMKAALAVDNPAGNNRRHCHGNWSMTGLRLDDEDSADSHQACSIGAYNWIGQTD